ncbi:MAG: hypothetical protein Q8K65_09370 [Alphaproteobacteria bacterium]|nr:hypothetical protein [Alphaproteobacteria bacterium]
MTQSDYYTVCIHTETGDETYTVCAASDYAAARRVCLLTGRMASSEHDVQRLPHRLMRFPFLSAPEKPQSCLPSSSGAASVHGVVPRLDISVVPRLDISVMPRAGIV